MKWNTLDRHVKYLYANWCNTAGGGPAESNLKFDNALLRAVVHSPGSRELCREGSDVLPRVYHVQKPYCRWYILCGPSCVYISRPYRQFSWRERLLARLISLWRRLLFAREQTPPFPGCVITSSLLLDVRGMRVREEIWVCMEISIWYFF